MSIKLCLCNFLLNVRHSNLIGPISQRFRDIAGFRAYDPTPIPPYFGGVPVAPDRQCCGIVTVSRYRKLFGREIIFEVFQLPL